MPVFGGDESVSSSFLADDMIESEELVVALVKATTSQKKTERTSSSSQQPMCTVETRGEDEEEKEKEVEENNEESGEEQREPNPREESEEDEPPREEEEASSTKRTTPFDTYKQRILSSTPVTPNHTSTRSSLNHINNDQNAPGVDGATTATVTPTIAPRLSSNLMINTATATAMATTAVLPSMAQQSPTFQTVRNLVMPLPVSPAAGAGAGAGSLEYYVPLVETVFSSQSTTVSLFDNALDDESENGSGEDKDDDEYDDSGHSPTSKNNADDEDNNHTDAAANAYTTDYDHDPDHDDTSSVDGVRTVSSKEAVTESNEYVTKAEALAKEMQEILHEFQSTPHPSMETTTVVPEHQHLSTTDPNTSSRSSSSSSATTTTAAMEEENTAGVPPRTPKGTGSYDSPTVTPSPKNHPEETVVAASAATCNNVNTAILASGSSSSSLSVASSTSSSSPFPVGTGDPERVQHPRRCRSSTTGVHCPGSPAPPSSPTTSTRTMTSLLGAAAALRSPPSSIGASSSVSVSSTTSSTSGLRRRTRRKQVDAGAAPAAVLSSLMLVSLVSVLRYYYFDNGSSSSSNSSSSIITLAASTSALTTAVGWTVMGTAMVGIPIVLLEYACFGSSLISSSRGPLHHFVEENPELKKFLKAVRRKRLRAGWWYPAEVRTLRQDLDKQQQHQRSQQQQSDEESEARSLQRQLQSDQHERERRQLADLLEGERAEWVVVKEQLTLAVEQEKASNATLHNELLHEAHKVHQLNDKQCQLEGDLEFERSQWNDARTGLQRQLSAAIAAQADETKTRDLVEQMEVSYNEERKHREVERTRWQRTSDNTKAEIEDLKALHSTENQESEQKFEDKMREWDSERRALQLEVETHKNAMQQLEEQHVHQIQELDEAYTTDQAGFELERTQLEESLRTCTTEAAVAQAEYQAAMEALATEVTTTKDDLRTTRDDYTTRIEQFQHDLSIAHEEAEEVQYAYETRIEILELELAGAKQTPTTASLDEHGRVLELETTLTNERAQWVASYEKLEQELSLANETAVLAQTELKCTQRTIEKTKQAFLTPEQKELEPAARLMKSMMAKADRLCLELQQKTVQISELENSVAQFEKIIALQTQTDSDKIISLQTQPEKLEDDKRGGSTSNILDEIEEANSIDSDLVQSVSSLHYRIDAFPSPSLHYTRSIDLTASSNVTADTGVTCYSWVQKVQQTHSSEKRHLLHGMLSQHLQWKNANRHIGQLLGSSRAALEAIDHDSNTVEGDRLIHYTAVSASAKLYMNRLIGKTGRDDMLYVHDGTPTQLLSSMIDHDYSSSNHHKFMEDSVRSIIEDSIRSNRSVEMTLAANPWLRNAQVWEQFLSSFFMAKTSPFRVCQSAIARFWNTTSIIGGSQIGTDDPKKPTTAVAAAAATVAWGGLSSIFFRGRAEAATTATETETDNQNTISNKTVEQ